MVITRISFDRGELVLRLVMLAKRRWFFWSQVKTSFQFHLHHLQALWHWTNHLDFSYLTFSSAEWNLLWGLEINVCNLLAQLLVYVLIRNSVSGRIGDTSEWNYRSFWIKTRFRGPVLWFGILWFVQIWDEKIANIGLAAYLSLAGVMCLLELWFLTLWMVELGRDNKT